MKNRPFTLIELLTVMAVILILLALLLGSLEKAKISAYKAACVSNLRQWGIAFQLYAHDSDDYISTRSVEDKQWYDLYSIYASGPEACDFERSGHSTRLLFCPAATAKLHGGFKELPSYIANTRLGGAARASGSDPAAYKGWISYGARKLGGCRRPNQPMILMDGNSPNLGGWATPTNPFATSVDCNVFFQGSNPGTVDSGETTAANLKINVITLGQRYDTTRHNHSTGMAHPDGSVSSATIGYVQPPFTTTSVVTPVMTNGEGNLHFALYAADGLDTIWSR